MAARRIKSPAFFGRPAPKRGWHREGDSLDFHGQHLRVTVHHYVGCGKAFFVTCYELRIERHQLKATEIEDAKVEAITFCRRQADLYVADLKTTETGSNSQGGGT